MSSFRVTVHISPREGILDPQGKAVADALQSLGFRDLTDVRIGRYIILHVKASDQADAGQQVRDMCDRLLANPVTEDYDIAALEES